MKTAEYLLNKRKKIIQLFVDYFKINKIISSFCFYFDFKD